MNTFDPAQADTLRQLLQRREAELRALLSEPGELRELAEGELREVDDFKALASAQSEEAVEDAMSEHAAHELAQTQAALRRLANGSYGRCLDCGEAIDLRRLVALPATPYCAACQSAHEDERPGAARH